MLASSSKLKKVSVRFMDRDIYVNRGRLYLANASPNDALSIKDSLRFNDARECFIFGLTPEEALLEPFLDNNSKNYTIFFDDMPIGMCGTNKLEDNIGSVWMLGTEQITQNKFSFLKGCPDVVDILQDDFESITNYVPVDHYETIQWLSWMGFIIKEDVYNMNGHMMFKFERFAKRKNNVINLYTRPVTH